MNKAKLDILLKCVGDKLLQRGLQADITLYGGSALMLGFGLRECTKDVDVVMDKWDQHDLRIIAAEIADECGLDKHWFNDDVQHLVGDREETALYLAYPSIASPVLRVFTPKPEYMLALQVRALASIQLSDDQNAPLGKHAVDVRHLAESLGFTKTQTLDCVKYFFPNRQLPGVVLKWLDITFDELEPALA